VLLAAHELSDLLHYRNQSRCPIVAYNEVMDLIITVVIVAAVLGLSEVWWHRHLRHDEFSRKFVHITVGSFVAFWPFFLEWREIELLSLAFLIVVGASKYLNVFKAIHSVQRPTYGELFFAIAVGAVAFTTHNKWVYMAALLQMSLADGMAAVIGVKYGVSNQYKVIGQVKSIAGTTTFVFISVLILIVYQHYSLNHLGPIWIVGLSVLSAGIENIGVSGLDNVLVPLVTALLLVR
jgi:phytol kinase